MTTPVIGGGAGAYQCIVADPPWRYAGPGSFAASKAANDTGLSGKASSDSRYGSMSVDEICALRPPAADNAHLYLWFTNSFAVEAHQIATAWGFDPKTIITWTKVKADGSPSMKMGYYFRGATEHILFAVRGSLRLLPKEGVPTAMLWPRTAHSVKPDAFYGLVERCSPGPYLELFARRQRPGWHHWGDQVPCDVALGERPSVAS